MWRAAGVKREELEALPGRLVWVKAEGPGIGFGVRPSAFSSSGKTG